MKVTRILSAVLVIFSLAFAAGCQATGDPNGASGTSSAGGGAGGAGSSGGGGY